MKVFKVRQINTRTEDMLAEVERFNREIIDLDIPDKPTLLSHDRQRFATKFMQEEIGEFDRACTVGDIQEAADALIDLVYVALGRLVEMGIPPGPVFQEVQRANMDKKRGQTKRGDACDAVKPDGWKAPDHSWLLDVTAEDIKQALRRRLPPITPPKEARAPSGHYIGLDRKVDGLADKKDVMSKPQIALIPYEALVHEANGMAYGAYIKYSPWDWTKGRRFSEVVSSAQHHIGAWFDGEIIDPDSGVHHLGLARCNLGMLISWEARGMKHIDDRRPVHTVVYHRPTEGADAQL